MIVKPQWLNTWQAEKAELFRAEGFPTRKTEDWKYTNVSVIAENNFKPVKALLIPSAVEGSPPARTERGSGDPSTVLGMTGGTEDSYRLVVLDGQLRRDMSDLPNENQVSITTWSEQYSNNPEWLQVLFSQFSSAKSTPFSNLNQANFDDGLIIKVSDDAILERPIQIVYVTSNQNECIEQHLHNLIALGKNSRVVFLESVQNHNSKMSFYNTVTNVFSDEGSQLEFFKLSPQQEDSLQISTMAFLQERDSRVNAYHFGLGGRLVRDDLHFMLKHQGAGCGLYGFYALDGSEHYDCHSRIDHVGHSTESQQIYKGIMDGRSRGVFNGKIVVHEKASRVSAKQRNNNLLLTKMAEINTKPELEIYSEDVSCSHGATVGELDAKALFYLRSRGLSESEAKQLLMQAFAEEILQKIPRDTVSTSFISEWLTKRVMQKLFNTPNLGGENE